MSSKSIVLGILVGGAIGASAALLSTPVSGRDVRNCLKDQFIDMLNLINNLKDQLRETSKEGVVIVKELTDEMKKSVEEWKETVEPHQEGIYHYLEQIEASLRDLENKVKSI
ncbi:MULTISPECIES: YtxH domain-containing protein [unclassified Oceanobacillus]|uniref:YtxH domain-containing protein n=1 Tax=unclassified Oceanobacillus TaxID=2630292 RepID=UPI0012EC554D|nr:YtxH domain-containing protein [Oceanobacillus sp. AG]